MMLKRIKELLSRRGKTRAAAAPSVAVPEAPAVRYGPKVVHQPIPVKDLDDDAVKIVNRLTRFDHSAFLVGGCVRDLLLELKPKDFDIGTSATPRQIKRVFRNCRIIGRRFRLAHIYFQNGKIIEVATFRAQDGDDAAAAVVGGAGSDDLLIRDDNQFGTMEEDALRRDFTINSLFYDVANGNVLDHADGLGDLRRRLVRTIGDPVVRFKEDPIRILRAIKFAARLNFEIEPRTLEGLQATRNEIPKAATPRVLEELNRFARNEAARRSFDLMRETGVFDVILPELAGFYARDEDAWALLAHMLDGIDRRQAERGESSLGMLLAALLMPTLRAEFGWERSGKANPPRGFDVRACVERRLRPLSLRLRIAKKDQEYCRQLFLSLYRMVPLAAARHNVRRAILRRTCVHDAIAFLAAAADLWGGDFREAHEDWRRAAAASEPAAESPSTPQSRLAEGADRDEAGRRRRGRRGGRRRRGGAGRGAAEGDEAATAAPRVAREGGEPPRPSRRDDRRDGGKAAEPAMPPVWDDDYFFAALPTVPAMAGEEVSGDRYGAAALAAETRDDATENGTRADAADDVAAGDAGRDGDDVEGDGAPGGRPRRRRRGGRRRRGRRGGGADGDGGSGGSGGGSADGDGASEA